MPGVATYPAQQEVIIQGDVGETFYVITTGTVEVYTQTETGEKLRLRTLVSGDHFGEIALLKNRPRTATVRTLTPCELYTFTRDEFLELLESNPRLRGCIEDEMSSVLRVQHAG